MPTGQPPLAQIRAVVVAARTLVTLRRPRIDRAQHGSGTGEGWLLQVGYWLGWLLATLIESRTH